MTSLPLHPAIVHLPLGLAFVIPLLAAGFGWALWTGRIHRRGWVAVVLLQALLVAGGLAAMSTGEREEHTVESLVPEAALEQHEAYAEQFVWAAGITFTMAALVLVVRRKPAAQLLIVVTVLGAVTVAGAAIRVGHAGGRLVYVHNAGQAYSSGAALGASRPGTALPSARTRDRREHER